MAASIPQWWEAPVSLMNQAVGRRVANVVAPAAAREQNKHDRAGVETRPIPHHRTVQSIPQQGGNTPRKSRPMNSIAPQEIWRSEAFAEDLCDSLFSSPAEDAKVPQRLSNTLLCALPVAVALVGGVAAFFHTIG